MAVHHVFSRCNIGIVGPNLDEFKEGALRQGFSAVHHRGREAFPLLYPPLEAVQPQAGALH